MFLFVTSTSSATDNDYVHSSCATFSTKSYLGMGNGVKESIDSVVRGAIIDLQKGHSKRYSWRKEKYIFCVCVKIFFCHLTVLRCRCNVSSAENQLKSIPEEGDSIFIGDTHLEHHKAVFQKVVVLAYLVDRGQE